MTKVVNIKYSECDVYIGRANSYYKMAHSILPIPLILINLMIEKQY